MQSTFHPINHYMYLYESMIIFSNTGNVRILSDDTRSSTDQVNSPTVTVTYSDNTVAIVGGIVAVVFIIAITTVIVIVVLRNHRKKFELSQARYYCLSVLAS